MLSAQTHGPVSDLMLKMASEFFVHGIDDLRRCAGGLNDLHVYDPVAMAWTDLSIPLAGTPPSPRLAHGFATAADKLYVHAGSIGGGLFRRRMRK